MIARLAYRVGQFRRALGARPDEAMVDQARVWLTPAQWQLFASLAPRDQWHGVQTLRLLGDRRRDDPELAVAALLHDAGKGYIELYQRVLFVVLARWPRLLARCASAGGSGWRAALYRLWHHCEAGAELARAVGTSERVALLIREHHAPPADTAAAALRAADERA